MKRIKTLNKIGKNKNVRHYALTESPTFSRGKYGVTRARVPILIHKMSYDDMIEASSLATNYMRGIITVGEKEPSYKASVFLGIIKRQSAKNRKMAQETINYLNNQIVEKNKIENKPSATTMRIYKEMMKDKNK